MVKYRLADEEINSINDAIEIKVGISYLKLNL